MLRPRARGCDAPAAGVWAASWRLLSLGWDDSPIEEALAIRQAVRVYLSKPVIGARDRPPVSTDRKVHVCCLADTGRGRLGRGARDGAVAGRARDGFVGVEHRLSVLPTGRREPPRSPDKRGSPRVRLGMCTE